MELIYTPNEESNDVTKIQNELLSTSFGAPSPGFGILSLILMMIFNPEVMTTGRHPFPTSNEEAFVEEYEAATTEEEKQDVLRSHLDEYWGKLFDKTRNMNTEDEQDLLNRLSDVDSRLKELIEEKQNIIDDWVME